MHTQVIQLQQSLQFNEIISASIRANCVVFSLNIVFLEHFRYLYIYLFFFCVDNNNIAWAQKKIKKILSTVWSKCDPIHMYHAMLAFGFTIQKLFFFSCSFFSLFQMGENVKRKLSKQKPHTNTSCEKSLRVVKNIK